MLLDDDRGFDNIKLPDDLDPVRERLHAEIKRVIVEHDLHWKELREITGDPWTKHTKSNFKKKSVWWGAQKYIRVARAMGIDTDFDFRPVPSPAVERVLQRRRLAAQYAAAD